MSPQRTSRTPRRRYHLQRLWLLLLCVSGLLACATPTRQEIRLEAYSWWTQTSEQHAFDSVLELYNHANEGHSEADQVTGDINADEVRATLTARLLAGAPPSTFQANAGADLLRWTAMDTTDRVLDSSSRIDPLTDLFERVRLGPGVLPEALDKAVRAGPDRLPYAVPLNIHRLNVIYYNTNALEEYARQHGGESFLKFAQLCPTDVATRLDHPDQKLDLEIAVGTKNSFALTLLTFENLLPAVASQGAYSGASGGTLYDELFTGSLPESQWHDPVLLALQCVQYLSRSFLRNEDLSWADALHRVETGEAAFSVMGDWANGELRDALETFTVDAQPFPGSEDTFVFTSDTFPLPGAAPHRKESEDLLEMLASPEAQRVFSQEKGSIPARWDIPPDEFKKLGERARQTRDDFASSAIHKSIATSGLFPPYFPDDLSTKLSAMTAEDASKDSIQSVIDFLRDMQPLLGLWQDRIRTGQQAP